MTREQFFDKLATEPLYFRYDFEDVVIRTVPFGKDDLPIYVKFRGKDEFKAQKGSSVVSDGLIISNIITKEEYENFR